MRDYDVISADSHLETSPDVWRGYVDKEFREWAPRVEKLSGGGDAWVLPGTGNVVPLGLNFFSTSSDPRARWQSAKPIGVSYDDGLLGTGDGNSRLQEMDVDGVDAEVLFPAVSGQRSLAGIPREAYIAVVRGYNDWLSQEFCAADPDRLWGVAMLPLTGVQDAIEEMTRVDSLPGIRTVALAEWPNGSGSPEAEDDQFWQAAIDLGMPLSSHGFFGSGAGGDKRIPPGAIPGVNFANINSMLSKNPRAYTGTQLITEGVLDRLPDLRIYWAETGIGWIPSFCEYADDEYHRHRYWAGVQLAHEPSWYWRNCFKYSFQIDHHGIRNRDDIGLDNLMWATDFPHMNCDWPDSEIVIKNQLGDLPDAERRKIIRDTALDFFRVPVA